MNVGELFVKLRLAQDAKNLQTASTFRKSLNNLKENANGFRSEIQNIIKDKFPDFFKKGENATNGLIGGFIALIGKAKVAAAAILATVAAMLKLTSKSAEASEHLYRFSLNTGMNTDMIQRWQKEAAQAGIAAEEITSSFDRLQQATMEIQRGGGNAGAFQMAGVSWFASAETQIKQIQRMLKTVPAAMGTMYARNLGLSDEMIAFLRIRDQLEPTDNLILSQKEIKELNEFQRDLRATWETFRNAWMKLGAMILPVTKPIMYFLRRLIMIPADIIEWMNALESRRNRILATIAIIGGALLAIFAPIFLKIALIGAAIAAVLLIVEDIWSYFRGDESYTGDLVEAVKKAWKMGIDWLKKAWTDFLAWLYEKTIGALLAMFTGNKIPFILRLLGVGVDKEGQGKEGGNPQQGFGLFGNLWEGIKDMFTPTQMTPALATGTIMNSSPSMNQNIKIDVNGAKDPAAIGEEIRKRINLETSNAVYQMPRQEH